MKENFTPSLAALLVHEGGYVNNPRDPGGATNRGVTQRTYDAWRISQKLPTRDVRSINDYETGAIYRSNYWNICHGDDLPAGVDYCVFDFAVNSGSHEADVCLQRALAALQAAAGVMVDGVIGPKTLAAVNATDPRRIIHEVCVDRLIFMREHCDWADFGNGWSHRVADVEAQAGGMCA